ncbi:MULTISPECIES: cyclophilin-like fold protein [Spirosoma]|nr:MULTISPECIES: cyclophilin-like fold protein [Spirosoma]
MACTLENPIASGILNGESPETQTNDAIESRLNIRIGATVFTATLLNNPTATALVARLPLTIPMQELNGNEKFAELPNALPSRASAPGTIQTGDLMLYGSTTLVLFYKTFPTAYSYTKLGRVDNPAGLAAALGSGSVTVTFERQ